MILDKLPNVTLTNVTITDGTATFQGQCPATPELEQAMKPCFEPWKPKEEEVNWFVTQFGTITSEHWRGSEYEIARWKSGNCFPTRFLAEATAEAEQITRKVVQMRALDLDVTEERQKLCEMECNIIMAWRPFLKPHA